MTAESSSGPIAGTSGALRVLVTGGAGFIGRAVVARLVADEVDVVVLDSLRADVHPAGVALALPPSVRLEVGDVRDRDQVARALGGVDVVVHLAAKVGLGVDLGDLDDYVSSNDLGTAVLLQETARAGVERVVVASSMVVYGEGAYRCPEHGAVQPAARREVDLAAGRFEPGCPVCGEPLAPELVSEEAVTDPRNGYAATKLHQEHLATVWSRETGGRAVALRFHNVYGSGLPKNTPYAGVAALFASALQRGEAPRVFEDGGQRRDFVHVDDVAAAVVAGVGSESTGPTGQLRAFNVGSGVVHTIGDLATAMSTSWGGPPPVVTGEYRLGDVRHVTASSARIAQELGWSARIRFQDGIDQLASAWGDVQPAISDR
jgi:dTDP-L-rhamnose 4-epimerase